MLTRLSRRSFLALVSGAAVGLRRSPAAGAEATRPRIGAIRWDAWYDPTSRPGRAVAASLGPQQYHFRVPFFGRIVSDDTVTIDGGRQEIIDLEIELASSAGLDFWAFGAYARDSAMSKALELFLASRLKSKINFCLLCGLGLWGSKDTSSKVLDWHAELMSDASYETVMDNRPLYFLGFLSDRLIAEKWNGLEQIKTAIRSFADRVESIGRRRPYIVILDGSAPRAYQLMTALGCDAIGRYEVNSNRRRATFAKLAEEARQTWEEQARFAAMVPTITTGYDRRPRVEHPVPWETAHSYPGSMDVYYETAAPWEITRHVRDCLSWMSENRRQAPAHRALIYAWNENDEGGWLIPTLGEGNARLRALSEALDESRSR